MMIKKALLSWATAKKASRNSRGFPDGT